MSEKLHPPFNGQLRREYGVTVSFEREGECRTLVRKRMPVREALLSVIAEVEQSGPGWSVTAISTPSTIWRDLKGIRPADQRPEESLLHRIGRSDLLARQRPVTSEPRSAFNVRRRRK